jgi:hypothetical protein
LRFDTFNRDFEELAPLIESVWGGHFGEQTRFRYPPEWLAGFFGAAGSDPDLLVEGRDDSGKIVAFLAAVPRRVLIQGREVRIGLVTLLTSARHNVGMVGLGIERELFRRVAAAGLYGTYHFCLAGQRTPELVAWAAAAQKTPAVEIAPVPSLIGFAKPAPESETPDVRPLADEDVARVAELVEAAGRALPIARLATPSEFRTWLHQAPPKRALALLRDGRPVGVCVYARRQLLGKDVTEVANIDLLVAPDATPAEATQFGRAIASDAAAHGANYVVAPQRAPSVFPHARAAGLRLAMRTLRVFIVPSAPTDTVEPGVAHLLEVE